MLSVKQKYIVLDDCLIKNGGTSLTLESILEDRKLDCFFISMSSLDESLIEMNKDKIWIIGNFLTVAKEQKLDIFIKLLESCRFVKIEFDYNFCAYRSETGHEIFKKEKCNCPHGENGDPYLAKIYNLFCKNSLHTFFMSERQRAIYSTHLPILDFRKSSILSSCFTKKMLSLFENLKNNTKNDKYAILEGFGGFHSLAKGVKSAKEFCEANNIKYDILPNQDYEKHIQTLSTYKGIVFMPIIDDTCPRCIIEARLLNLDVICNANCQHIFEYWWKDKSITLEYLKSRPLFFWSVIDSL